MAWNQRSRVLAMAFAIQVGGSGAFVQPAAATDLLAVANATNTNEPLTADDPTATGAVWDSPPVRLGKRATIGGTVPLRGPGGATPPASGGYVPGRILVAGGWSETRNAAPINGTLQAGSTTTALSLGAAESAVDDFYLGLPIQQASIGTGFQQTTLIRDYIGSTKSAILAETLGGAPATGAAYTIPMYLAYRLGTLTTGQTYLSCSVWRDKKRYDYRDFAPTSIAFTVPVANDANTSFPDMTFSGNATEQAVVDDITPTNSAAFAAQLQVAVAPARGGKFYLDSVKLGHQSLSFTVATTVGAASNQNQAAGQDGYDILSGSRTIALDLNQMAVADFDLLSRENNQTPVPILSTWGLLAGNRFGLLIPNATLQPFSPGDRNGYVSLTGNANTSDINNSAAFTIWW